MTVAARSRHPAPRRRVPAAPPAANVRAVRVPASDARRLTAPLLTATVAALNLVGVMMVLSASSVVSLEEHGSAWYLFERQLGWTALGAVAFFVGMRVDYRVWRRAAPVLLLAAVVLLLVVLVPGVGVYVGGSRRWLGTAALRFQPSELAKLAILLWVADLLARRANHVDDWVRVLRPALLVFATVGALILVEPDLDSTVVIGMVVVGLLVAGGLSGRRLVHLLGVGAVMLVVFAVAAPYRLARVETFLHPSGDPTNAGYQVMQSLIALGSGGVTGVGLGAGSAKWSFLPNAHTDFIFAIIGEELGLVGCLLVVALFVALAALGVRAALHAPDRFGMLLAAGITVWISGQALVNLGGVVGVLPVSGITLPFLSFGGSSLVVMMFVVGILTNVARRARPVRPPRRPAPAAKGARG